MMFRSYAQLAATSSGLDAVPVLNPGCGAGTVEVAIADVVEVVSVITGVADSVAVVSGSMDVADSIIAVSDIIEVAGTVELSMDGKAVETGRESVVTIT